jgi:hypothetical protein
VPLAIGVLGTDFLGDGADGRLPDVLRGVAANMRADDGLVLQADIAKTLIELNSQQAAYQAALKAGASIVQASLMDFLR